jgi:DNA-directed RNA polymerase subunit RPC12/RpoP
MPKTYKNIKIPEETYISLKELRKILAKKGYDSLDEKFRQFLDYKPKKCPKCNHEMDGIVITAEYYKCPNCNFQQPLFKLETSGAIAIGTLIGLGIAGLIYLLTK